MKRTSYAASLYRIIERRERQQGVNVDVGYVTDRRVTGNTGANYSVNVRGRAATGISSISTDLEPGQTVMVQRGGRGNATTQVQGQAAPELRATQAPQSFTYDPTGVVMR